MDAMKLRLLNSVFDFDVQVESTYGVLGVNCQLVNIFYWPAIYSSWIS